MLDYELFFRTIRRLCILMPKIDIKYEFYYDRGIAVISYKANNIKVDSYINQKELIVIIEDITKYVDNIKNALILEFKKNYL